MPFMFCIDSSFVYLPGQIRLKRSYIDNRIDTFPTHPAYYSHRRYDSLPSHELHHNFHPPYSLDSAHDIGLDSLDPLNIPDTRARAVPSSPPRSPSFPKQPLEFGPLLFSESDDGQDDGLDFSSLLPSVLDVKTPVSERAAKEADDIMEDFLNFLDLRGLFLLKRIIPPAVSPYIYILCL